MYIHGPLSNFSLPQPVDNQTAWEKCNQIMHYAFFLLIWRDKMWVYQRRTQITMQTIWIWKYAKCKKYTIEKDTHAFKVILFRPIPIFFEATTFYCIRPHIHKCTQHWWTHPRHTVEIKKLQYEILWHIYLGIFEGHMWLGSNVVRQRGGRKGEKMVFRRLIWSTFVLRGHKWPKGLWRGCCLLLHIFGKILVG